MEEKIRIDEVNSTEKKVVFNVPAEEVDRKFNEFFESIKDKVEIPGYRKGRAPINAIRSLFHSKAKATISQSLFSEYYATLLKDHGINPVGSPNIKNFTPESKFVGSFGFDNSFSVEFNVEVLPKIDPQGYTNLDIQFPNIDMDSLFETKMVQYQEQFAQRQPITDRGAKFGDMLVVDFKGYVDDKEFDGGSATGFTINSLGSANFIPGFEEQMIGMKSGETKDVVVNFPADYRAKNLAGKTAKFVVTVNNLIDVKLAEVDTDLAMMVGCTSVEEMNKKISQDVKEEVDKYIKQELDRDITSKLLQNNNFDIPKSMVDEEKKRLQSRIKMDTLPEAALVEIQRAAEFNVKRAIILEAIYDKETSLEITPDELDTMLETHSKMYNKPKDEFISLLHNSGQMDSFVGVLKISKVLDYIIKNAKKEEPLIQVVN